MPIEKMQIDNKKIVSAKVDTRVLAAITAGMWLTPQPPFKPTQKSQSGVFDRTLPKFNAAQLKNRFPEQILIGARSPFALVNARRVKNGEKAIDWNDDQYTAQKVKGLFQQYLGAESTLGAVSPKPGNQYEQLFDPQYNLTLFSRHGDAMNMAGTGVFTGASSGICTNATNWIPSTLPWTVGAYPTFDAPVQGGADDCWFIAALSSIAWTFPDVLTADNRSGIYILDPAGPLSGQQLVDDGYIYPSDDLPVPSGAGPTSPSFIWSHSIYPERWVAMMEKAFAIRYLKSGQDRNNVCTLPKGDPQYAVYVLKGDENWLRFFHDPLQTNGTRKNSCGTLVWESFGTPESLFFKLWDNCSSQTNNLFFRKTKQSTVAYTYASAGTSGIKYNTDVLVARHSYSLLGVYNESGQLTNLNGKPVPSGPNYVVLRNPWGFKPSGVTYGNRNKNITVPGGYGSFAQGPLPAFYEGPAYANLTNKNRDLWDTKDTNGKLLDTGRLMDGVFAMDYKSFARYFAGFSWV